MASLEPTVGWDEIDVSGQSFDVLPEGTYDLEVIESGLAEWQTEDDRGLQLRLKYVVTSGPHEGRWGFDKFDLNRLAKWTDKKTGQAQQGYLDNARKKLLEVALGFRNEASDTEQFLGIPFVGVLKHVPNKEPGKDPFQKWGKFRSTGDTPAQQPARQRQAAPRTNAAPSANASRPAPAWKKAG